MGGAETGIPLMRRLAHDARKRRTGPPGLVRRLRGGWGLIGSTVAPLVSCVLPSGGIAEDRGSGCSSAPTLSIRAARRGGEGRLKPNAWSATLCLRDAVRVDVICAAPRPPVRESGPVWAELLGTDDAATPVLRLANNTPPEVLRQLYGRPHFAVLSSLPFGRGVDEVRPDGRASQDFRRWPTRWDRCRSRGKAR